MGVVLAGLASAENRAQATGRRDLEARFAVRGSTAAGFLETYAGYVLGRERDLATDALGGSTVSDAQFQSFRKTLDFGPAVLLDSTGRVLNVAPYRADLIGKNLAPTYAHLSAAVAGHQAVSNAVPSAAQGVPVVAFATPFDSPAGRRVVSGAYDLSSSPLGVYLRNLLPYQGGAVYLVDASGNIVATSSGAAGPFGKVGMPLANALRTQARGTYHPSPGATAYLASDTVGGTPWRLVITVPAGVLFRPLDRAERLLPWLFLVAFGFAAGILAELWVRGRNKRRQMELYALVDKLTDLPNRRAAEEHLGRLFRSARRHHTHLGVMMIDVDRFKAFNDTFGHATGDDVLKSVASRIQGCLRGEDVVSRWGGEEFVVLLPLADAAGIAVVAERVRDAVAIMLASATGAEMQVTVSIGTAMSADNEGEAALVARADAALYEAKGSGRNQVIAAAVPATDDLPAALPT